MKAWRPVPCVIAAVEVFGLCGAGKSTLMRRLAPMIESRSGGRVRAERPVRPYGAASLCRTLVLALRAVGGDPLGMLGFLLQPSSWWLIGKLGYRWAGMALRPRETGWLLLDSGVLQPFVSYAIEYGGRVPPVEPLLAALPMPRVALYVRAAAPTARARYVARARAAQKELPCEDWTRRFAVGEATCASVLAACRRARCAVVEIVNEDEPDAAVLERTARAIAVALGLEPPEACSP